MVSVVCVDKASHFSYCHIFKYDIFLIWFLIHIYICLGKGPEWAKNLKSGDFELICPQLKERVKYNEFAKCNLATVPAHAVITREDARTDVVNVLKQAQVSSLQFCVDFPVI